MSTLINQDDLVTGDTHILSDLSSLPEVDLLPKNQAIIKEEKPSSKSQFVSVDSTTDNPFENTLSNLDTIKQLPDNWDSYGSPPLDAKLYNNAKFFLQWIFSQFIIPEPFVVPVAGGGVQFEWQSRGRELEIEFSEPDSIEYLLVFEDNEMVEGSIKNIIDTRAINDLIEWMITG